MTEPPRTTTSPAAARASVTVARGGVAPATVASGSAAPDAAAGKTSAPGGSSPDAPDLPGGVVHDLPADLADALLADPTAAELWRGLTPLGRNEFVCWVADARKPETRARRIRRTGEELHEGRRRPCCWPGCRHRDRTGR